MLPRFQLSRIRENLRKQREIPYTPLVAKPRPVVGIPQGGRHQFARIDFPFTVRFLQEWLPENPRELAAEGVGEFAHDIGDTFHWGVPSDFEIDWTSYRNQSCQRPSEGRFSGHSEIYGIIRYTVEVQDLLRSRYPAVALKGFQGFLWREFEEKLRTGKGPIIHRRKYAPRKWAFWGHARPMDRFADTHAKPAHLKWINADPDIEPLTIVEPRHRSLSGSTQWVEFTIFSGIFSDIE